MSIGMRIKERRKALKMSADELGQKIGKNRATIYRYEKGEIENLPLDMLEPIAKALDTTAQYLMGWEKVQKNNDAIVDIISRLRTDNEFFEVSLFLNKLDKDQLISVKQMLTAFLK